MAAQPCKECKRRPKLYGRHRCATCQLRSLPIGEQVEASRRRLAMVPPELRVKRSKAIVAQAPEGTSFCAGCQSFRDIVDFPKNGTTCRACASARQHAAMVEKTYGISAEDYATLLERQGGRCAICRARPKSKRLAVDHDHKSGHVRGLLCSRCNHDLLGSAWDSLALVSGLWHYMNTPPATGDWLPPEKAAPIGIIETAAVRPTEPSKPELAIVSRHARNSAPAPAEDAVECDRAHVYPIGARRVEGKRGLWEVWVSDEVDTDAPY